MCASPWRERREAYLRECGRWADLFREDYVTRFAVIEGGAKRVRCGVGPDKPALILLGAGAGDLRERLEACDCSQQKRQPQPGGDAGAVSRACPEAEGDLYGGSRRLIALAHPLDVRVSGKAQTRRRRNVARTEQDINHRLAWPRS